MYSNILYSMNLHIIQHLLIWLMQNVTELKVKCLVPGPMAV